MNWSEIREVGVSTASFMVRTGWPGSSGRAVGHARSRPGRAGLALVERDHPLKGLADVDGEAPGLAWSPSKPAIKSGSASAAAAPGGREAEHALGEGSTTSTGSGVGADRLGVAGERLGLGRPTEIEQGPGQHLGRMSGLVVRRPEGPPIDLQVKKGTTHSRGSLASRPAMHRRRIHISDVLFLSGLDILPHSATSFPVQIRPAHTSCGRPDASHSGFSGPT